MVKEGLGFYLSNVDDTFNDRQKNVFGELDRLENAGPSNRLTEDEFNSSSRRAVVSEKNQRVLKHFKGRDSIFKRQEQPLLRRKCKVLLPDYAKNPHKWRKYTLSDTPEDVMTEASNRAVAMNFLNSLKPASSSADKEGSAGPGKIVFNKPAVPAKRPNIDEKAVYAKNKFLMPEYVVGSKPVKKPKEAKPKPEAEVSYARVTLSHLEDEDD